MVPSYIKPTLTISLLLTSTCFVVTPARADFTVTNGQTIATATLGNTQTGMIDSGGTVTGDVDANSTNNAVLTNNGTIGGAIVSYFSTHFTATNNGILTNGIDGNVSSYLTFINSGIVSSYVAVDTSDHFTLVNSGSISNLINATTSTNAKIINTGSINNQLAANNSQNLTITNSGTISSIDASNTNGLILTIQGGSNIPGGIKFTSATNGLIRLETGMSYPREGGGFGSGNSGTAIAPTITDGTAGVNYTIEEINISSGLSSGAYVVTNGTDSYAVTPDVFTSAENTFISQSLTQAGNLVVSHQLHHITPATPSLTIDETSPLNIEPAAGELLVAERNLWVESYGLYQERPTDGDSAYSRTHGGGIVIGLDLPEDNSGLQRGLYGGTYKGQIRIGKSGFRTIDSEGFMIGGYIGYTLDTTYISTQLMGGVSNNTSNRLVGNTQANAQYNTYYLSPSITIAHPLSHEEYGIKLIPSVTVFYNGQYSGSYDENGSSANESVESRFYNSAGARALIEGSLTPSLIGKTTRFTPSFRIGASYETSFGNNDVNLRVLGSDVSLHTQSGSPHVDGLIGTTLNFESRDGLTVYVDLESQLGLNKDQSGDNFGGFARVGARWLF